MIMLRWCATIAFFPLLCSACGSSPASSIAPTPATLRANLGISAITASGESRSPGQAYRVTVHLRESAGTAATITAVDLTFLNGTTTVLTSHDDLPISSSKAANVCAPNGSVDTKEIVVVDADASHPYATAVQATITFTDASSVIGTTNATTTIPALPVPPPSTFTLTGLITDVATHAALADAQVEVLNGSNAGKTAFTNSSGTYVLQGLAADSFRLRFRATGYDSGDKDVSVPADTRADFDMRRTPPDYAGIWTGTYRISACQDIDPPGVQPLLLCGRFFGMSVPLSYRFTLSQNGASVTGTYKLVSPMFSCPCAGDYGTFDLAGSISSDGTLTLSGVGSSRGSGVQTNLTFNLRLIGSATLTGTVSGTHAVAVVGVLNDVPRATFSGTIVSGTR